MLGVGNSYAAFCLDEAIITFGEALDNELESKSSKAKTPRAAEGIQKLILEKWLKTGQFADSSGNSGFRTPTPTK